MAWLVVQFLYLWRQLGPVWHWPRRVELGSTRLLWISLLALDLFLFVGLRLQGGGPRGFSIWLALLLGQVGAVVSVLDRQFPLRAAVGGVLGACVILAAFIGAEFLFPASPVLQRILETVQDEVGSYQQRKAGSFFGSLLTLSAMSEFTVRMIPLVLFGAVARRLDRLTLFLLVLLSLLTLERSSFLAVGLMTGVWLLSPVRQDLKKRALAVMGVLALGAVLAAGPQRAYYRIFSVFHGGNSVANAANEGVNARLVQWLGATRVLKEFPFTGIGLDAFSEYAAKGKPPLDDRPYYALHTHNILFEMGVSGGLGALAALIAAIALLGRLAWGAQNRNWVVLAYVAGQGATLLVDCRIYVSWLAITFFWIPAIAWVSGLAADSKEERV